MMKSIILLCIAFPLISCGGNKTQGLLDEETTAKEIRQTDSVIFNKGVKLVESRIANNVHPPVVLDYAKPGGAGKDLGIGQYYSSIKYVKLKHPQKEEGKNQFFNPTGTMMLSGKGITNMSLYSTQVVITSDYILAGDPFYGLHCYDLSGNYLHTLTTVENPPKYKKKGFGADVSELVNVLAGFYIANDICIFTTLVKGKTVVNLYDLKKQETYYSKQIHVKNGLLLNREIFANYNYNPTSSKREAFIYTFNTAGDTLCKFMNYNILPQKLGANYHSIASRNELYYYNNRLTIRQSGNDTVYRVVAADKLEPAYILDFGKYKSDIQDLLKGNITDKKVPYEWVETDKLIFFTYRENGNERNSVFDKSEKKISYVNKITNMLPDGIPFNIKRIQSGGKGLYCMYTKDGLKILMDENPQHEKIISLYNDLQDNELLVMLLE